jgi:hypothetical protein
VLNQAEALLGYFWGQFCGCIMPCRLRKGTLPSIVTGLWAGLAINGYGKHLVTNYSGPDLNTLGYGFLNADRNTTRNTHGPQFLASDGLGPTHVSGALNVNKLGVHVFDDCFIPALVKELYCMLRLVGHQSPGNDEAEPLGHHKLV